VASSQQNKYMNQNLILYGKRVCFIGAHPDDIELGCGALISNIGNKAEILCMTLSDNKTNPELQNLYIEHKASMSVLGVTGDHDIVKNFETRRFPQVRQEILETMIDIKRSFKPEIVFVHTKNDIHQDHVTVTDEALRAFRGTTVLGFDVLRSSYGFFPHFLFEVTEEDVEKKLAALAEYKTYSNRYYFDSQITRATMIRHGALAERPFAEGFDLIRVVAEFGKE
jgi:LmbE family N-acetylglucosaminyl deacetylase